MTDGYPYQWLVEILLELILLLPGWPWWVPPTLPPGKPAGPLRRLWRWLRRK
jgi:hypothetical protein